MKILYLTNIPSPYRVAYFNCLGRLCDLTVLFECGYSSERDESWKSYKFTSFRGIICKGKRLKKDGGFSFLPVHYLRQETYDWIIVCNAISPMGLLETCYMKWRGIPYWIEGDGAFVPKRESLLKYLLKKITLSHAAGYLSTCRNHDLYYLRYGAERSAIYRYPFTSLNKIDILKQPVTGYQKKELRKALGIKENHVVVTVGQFIHRKGFDILIKASQKLGEEVGMYFIGGKSLDACSDRKQIHAISFLQPDELKRYYDAADIFVCPTREDIWGLVVNEAMARALPVITTDRCNAGLELIQNGINGYIVPAENADALAEKMYQLLFQSDLESMGAAALTAIKQYTVERMAETHMEIYEGNRK